MLIRIVRMSFQEGRVSDFLTIFNRSKSQIRAFPGCQRLELLRDLDQPSTFMTYSYWESPEALEAYRQSPLFRTTWAATKLLFSDKPQAFSVERLDLIA